MLKKYADRVKVAEQLGPPAIGATFLSRFFFGWERVPLLK